MVSGASESQMAMASALGPQLPADLRFKVRGPCALDQPGARLKCVRSSHTQTC